MIDWTKFDCLRCSYTAKHQQLHSLHSDTGAQIQGQIAGLLQQSLPNASTVRTYQSILILATYQCYWTHFVIYDDYLFFSSKDYAEGIRLVGNIIISHHCFVTKVHSLHGVGANFVLFQLHGTHSWTWKAGNKYELLPIRCSSTLRWFCCLEVLSTPPKCLSLDSTASLGGRIQFSVCSSVYKHCMIDLDCYKVMCWKGKAVWWDMGMSFSRWDTGDMDSWLVNLGLGATVYIYAFCSTIIFFKLLWFLLEEITTTHESIYLEQRVARHCLITFQIVLVQKFKNLILLKNCKNHWKKKEKEKIAWTCKNPPNTHLLFSWS